jgi:hypothetical protein
MHNHWLVALSFGITSAVGGVRVASAHRNGIIARGCEPCHGDALTSSIDVTVDRMTTTPGDSVTFTVSLRRADVSVGGLFVADPGVGSLVALPGEGLQANTSGLTQVAPKPAANGQVQFRFAWRSPASPGAARFELFGLAANGNGQPTGDAPGRYTLPLVFGCQAQPFYFDADGDGFGARNFADTLGCAEQPPPIGYAVTDDDCDDSRDAVHPGAPEQCNGRDDDCDGQIDQGASALEMWPDTDGDGYYGARSGTMMVACPPLSGYAAEPGDCAVLDAARHPGALELCNLVDDNCDGKIDEGVRPQCGVGLCRRVGVSCLREDCVSGIPSSEICNSLDDDCDGVVDQSPVCAVPPAGGVGGATSAAGGSQQAVGGMTVRENAGLTAEEAAGCTLTRRLRGSHQLWWCLATLACAGAVRTTSAHRRRLSNTRADRPRSCARCDGDERR